MGSQKRTQLRPRGATTSIVSQQTILKHASRDALIIVSAPRTTTSTIGKYRSVFCMAAQRWAEFQVKARAQGHARQCRCQRVHVLSQKRTQLRPRGATTSIVSQQAILKHAGRDALI